MSSQLELFHVQEAYAKADKPLSNEELYDSVAELAGIPKSALNEQSEIGKAKIKRSKLKRQIRWYSANPQVDEPSPEGGRRAGCLGALKQNQEGPA
ncbi:hypothetical protein PQD28_003426 [Proteus mirabilis]